MWFILQVVLFVSAGAAIHWIGFSNMNPLYLLGFVALVFYIVFRPTRRRDESEEQDEIEEVAVEIVKAITDLKKITKKTYGLAWELLDEYLSENEKRLPKEFYHLDDDMLGCFMAHVISYSEFSEDDVVEFLGGLEAEQARNVVEYMKLRLEGRMYGFAGREIKVEAFVR